MNIYKSRLLCLLVTFCFCIRSFCCTCPPSSLSLDECAKYELIFRCRIDSAKTCDHKPGEAFCEILELYKGNATAKFSLLFDCKDPCYQVIQAGQEWIIYTNYKQVRNAKLDWCSRSRKHFDNEREDFYTLNYGNDYDDELAFLRKNLGQHRVLQTAEQTGDRNIKPNTTQLILVLLCSIAGIVIFYVLFNRFFK